jgi:hypothetical protein
VKVEDSKSIVTSFDIESLPAYFVVQGTPDKVVFKSFENDTSTIDKAFEIASLHKY